jgi:hypothetical protein
VVRKKLGLPPLATSRPQGKRPLFFADDRRWRDVCGSALSRLALPPPPAMDRIDDFPTVQSERRLREILEKRGLPDTVEGRAAALASASLESGEQLAEGGHITALDASVGLDQDAMDVFWRRLEVFYRLGVPGFTLSAVMTSD